MEKANTEAIVLIQKGNAYKAFEKRTITIDNPLDDEVQIEVESFGLNYADVVARHGQYREAPPMPSVIGYEVVGKVVKVGVNVSSYLLGKRVLGFCRFGGYARKVNTKETAIIEIDDLVASEALALCTQSVTAYIWQNISPPS